MYCSKGWFFGFGFVFFIGCVGGYIGGCWVVAVFLRPGPSSMDDHADGKVELLQGGWCLTTGRCDINDRAVVFAINCLVRWWVVSLHVKISKK